MKLSANQGDFLSALGIAARGVSSRAAGQSALAGVLLSVEDGAVELRATDMELGIRLRAPATAERDGRVVLPGRLLLDVVRALPRGDLTIEYRSVENDVELVSGSSRFHLRTLPVEDFPRLPERGDAPAVAVPAQVFVETAGRVSRSASRDETRPHLTGVLVSASERELRMVATDSYRLSVKETELERAIERPLEVNVPARTLTELGRVVGAVGAEEISVV